MPTALSLRSSVPVRRRMKPAAVAAAVWLVAGSALSAQTATIEIREGLAISGVVRTGRTILRTDPIEAEIVAGRPMDPQPGDKNAEGVWTAVTANAEGWFEGPALARGAYLFATVEAPEECVRTLNAQGHGVVYVNDVPRAGDPYSAGYVNIPIPLKKGRNTLLFSVARGRVKATLETPTSPAYWQNVDMTLPDVRETARSDRHGAALATNATSQWLKVAIECSRASQSAETTTVVLPPYSVIKCPFLIPAQSPGDVPEPLQLKLVPSGDAALAGVRDTLNVPLRVRRLSETHRQTFTSEIDGSTQYYAVVPSHREPMENAALEHKPALILSLHGASVEATSQADAHSPKSWAVTACPTNRRPFGFDWEDWGRLDAFEVLKHASETFDTDPTRVYLTGHSMGGHGTWNLGATFPGSFAAIAPSAGWCSFWTYSAGPRPDPTTDAGRIVRDAANASDTAALTENLLDHGVFILHGDADDNVPIREAREMRERLRALGLEPGYHEQPGAGHWWDGPLAGADCLDWPGILDTFSRRRLPDDRDQVRVRFATFNPGQSASRGWVTIVNQQREMGLSKVDLSADCPNRTVRGSTQNVRTMVILATGLHGSGPVNFQIDEHTFSGVPQGLKREITLERGPQGWAVVTDPQTALRGHKVPGRAGPFKDAFNHRFVMVCGSRGTPEENAWALAKARLDAETWRVRGNGFAQVLTDEMFLAQPEAVQSRNVIVYGHADMNGAWQTLLADSPVQARRGEATVGTRTLKGENLSVMFVRPRKDDEGCSVGVIAGTGLCGLRLGDRMPIFVSGVGIPDVLITDESLLVDGEKGIVAAGFFGHDWSLAQGRVAFREPGNP